MGIITLTARTFGRAVSRGGVTLVDFWAPWCVLVVFDQPGGMLERDLEELITAIRSLDTDRMHREVVAMAAGQRASCVATPG
jgi:hypothetical protein